MLGALAPPATPLGVGCCPVDTFDFFLKFLGTFGNSLVKIRPFGLLACCCLLLTAACHGPNNHQHSKMLGGLAPQPPPPLGGGCPIETFDFFTKFLGTFGNSLLKIRPFGLLACWPVGLLACWPAANCCLPWPNPPPTLKNVGGLGTPSHPPWGGLLPHRHLRFF